MKSKFLLAFLCLNASYFAIAQVKQESKNKDVSVQPNIIVTENIPNVAAPLQEEAQMAHQWSGSSSFNSAEYWQNQKANNIKDILDFIPGVFAQQRNGAESARLSIRGSGLGRQFQGGGLILLQDGIPLNSADGSFDFQAIDPWLIDYVNVYRGSNGIALGGSTLGGVIQLGSTLPNSNQPNEMRLSGGSFDTQRGMLSYTMGDDTDFARLRASHFNQNGFRDQNQQRSNRIDLQYYSNNDTHYDHRIGIYHLNTQAELPSSLSRELIAENPSQTRGFNVFGNFNRDLTMTRLSYKLSGNNLSAAIFLTNKTLENPVFTYINRDSTDMGLNFAWNKGAHQFQFNSIWGNQDELRRENEAGLPGNDRLFRKQNAQTTTAGYLYTLPLQKNTISSTINLELGIQAIYAQRDIYETFPIEIKSNRSYSQINPRVALSYQPQPNMHWFSSLSRSFEAPSFAELNNGNQPGINSPIKAQSADTFEIGYKGFTQSLDWDFSLYHSRINNEFIRFRFPNGSTKTTNAENSTHLGFEGMISWQVSEGLFTRADKLSISKTYQNNQFRLNNDATYGNNKIPGIPEHYLQSRLIYEYSSDWRLIPSVEWVPSGYFIDLANTVKTDSYLLTGLSFIYKNSKKLQWYIDIKNLNNQTYISTSLPIPDAGGTDGNYFYSGEGRSFTAGIRWIFN